MSRPESKNVFYFPHYTKSTKELNLIEHKHDSEGYRSYYRLMELVADAEYHRLSVRTQDEKDMFDLGMKCNPEVIHILVRAGKIDRELWENERVIWMQDFVETLKPVYINRKKPLPDKNIVSTSNNSVSTGNNTEKKKENKTIQKKSSIATSSFDFKSLISEYKDLDVQKSAEKYHDLVGEPNEEGFRRWLDKDRGNGWNLKKPEFRDSPTGGKIAYCKKCKEKRFPANQAEINQRSICCKAKYVPNRPGEKE